jgi:hypothetical protein
VETLLYSTSQVALVEPMIAQPAAFLQVSTFSAASGAAAGANAGGESTSSGGVWMEMPGWVCITTARMLFVAEDTSRPEVSVPLHSLSRVERAGLSYLDIVWLLNLFLLPDRNLSQETKNALYLKLRIKNHVIATVTPLVPLHVLMLCSGGPPAAAGASLAREVL